MTFFATPGSIKAVKAYCVSDVEFTSALAVQAYQNVNIGILVGSMVSDIFSAAALSATISGPMSTFSGIVTLQRQMAEEMGTAFWRDVDTWSITTAMGESGSAEGISSVQDPEVCNYRLGIKLTEYYAGMVYLRLGTS